MVDNVNDDDDFNIEDLIPKDKDTKYTSSVVEELFDLEPNTTVADLQTIPTIADDIEDITNQEEDNSIQAQLATVFDYAIETFENSQETIQDLDPKYAARNAEVAAEYLKIALDSSKVRANIKSNKDKLKFAKGEDQSPDGLIFDRNDVLRALMQDKNTTDVEGVDDKTSS